MEQMMNQNEMAAGASMAAGKKEGKGMMFGMIACAILAIGGVGFGVYEMMQAGQSKQISDLKVEIKNNDGTTTALETDKIEVKEDTRTIIISDSNKTEKPEEYLYIGKWGIKIKLPDTLKNVGYMYDDTVGSLYLYGRPIDDDSENQSDRDFASPYFNHTTLGAISVYGADETCTGFEGETIKCGVEVTLDNGRTIQVHASTPQAIFSIDERQKELEVAAVNLIHEWATNPDNYSAI